jgi:DNA polymerase-3 subunit gamma/tau
VGLPGIILKVFRGYNLMTYIVLARKWRPMVFEDVIGQEHISHILMNALKNQRVAQAYIFSGPRGVGKTTTARLLAKAVNCENQPAINPCNKCANCKSITEGHSLDVIEIDGASNRGIDEIRNLRENIRFAPAAARYKIYIIDEVHMLTKEAFNALLKTLEEPPSHAIFIFATTEIHKVPLTILSRCQRFDFKRIALTKIVALLKKIVQAEKISIEDEALLLISRKAEGSMRDAESILDQMISIGGEKLSAEQVRESLGLIDQEIYFQFTELLLNKDSSKILEYAAKIFNSGHDLIDFLHGLQEHFRNLLLTAALKETKLLDVSDHYKAKYDSDAKQFKVKDLIHYLQILIDAEQQLKYSVFPELELEMLLLKLAHKPSSVNLEEIIAYLEQLKNNLPQQNKLEELDSPTDVTNSATILKGAENPNGSTSEIRGGQSTQTTSRKGFQNFKNTLENYKNLHDSRFKNRADQKPSIELDLAEFQTKWQHIVDKVRTQKVALGSFLEEGIPYQTEKSKLIIAYDKAATFHREHVEKNSKIIEKILLEDLQLPVKIGFTTIDFEAEGIERKPRTPEEILEDIKKKEPIIRKIIDVFDLDESMNKNI